LIEALVNLENESYGYIDASEAFAMVDTARKRKINQIAIFRNHSETPLSPIAASITKQTEG
jgi:hypothetical protein